MIGLRTALLAYSVLAVFAMLTLRGNFLVLALIILAAVAIKTVVAHLRSRQL